jgi:hypothetical protein
VLLAILLHTVPSKEDSHLKTELTYPVRESVPAFAVAQTVAALASVPATVGGYTMICTVSFDSVQTAFEMVHTNW